jgi:hypothetical protein
MVVHTYSWRIHSKTPSGGLKPWVVLSSMYIYFFLYALKHYHMEQELICPSMFYALVPPFHLLHIGVIIK